jgi:hypothetical protein
MQVSSVTVCFTTFMNARCMMQIRQWVREELIDAPQLTSMFLFAELPIPLSIAPPDLLFELRWSNVTDYQPFALLRE